MFDFKSQDEMTLVATSDKWTVGKHFNKAVPNRQPKGLLARVLSALGML